MIFLHFNFCHTHLQVCIYTHMHTAPVITIVLILLFYFPPHHCLLFGSLHANVVCNEQKKALKKRG